MIRFGLFKTGRFRFFPVHCSRQQMESWVSHQYSWCRFAPQPTPPPHPQRRAWWPNTGDTCRAALVSRGSINLGHLESPANPPTLHLLLLLLIKESSQSDDAVDRITRSLSSLEFLEDGKKRNIFHLSWNFSAPQKSQNWSSLEANLPMWKGGTSTLAVKKERWREGGKNRKGKEKKKDLLKTRRRPSGLEHTVANANTLPGWATRSVDGWMEVFWGWTDLKKGEKKIMSGYVASCCADECLSWSLSVWKFNTTAQPENILFSPVFSASWEKNRKSQIAEQFSLPKYSFPPPNPLNLWSRKDLLSTLSSGFKGPACIFFFLNIYKERKLAS